MSRKLTIDRHPEPENVIRCERIQSYGFTRQSEEDDGGPNVLSCEKCDVRYALFLRNPLTESFEAFWDQWVVELRAAVTKEHEIGPSNRRLISLRRSSGRRLKQEAVLAVGFVVRRMIKGDQVFFVFSRASF